MRDDPPDYNRPPDQRPTGVPGELEAADEFETVPPGAPPTGGTPSGGPPPPSAVESFERRAPAPPPAGRPADDITQAHSVPPSVPAGESTLCPRCGTENRPGVTFCRQCGQRLVAAGAATVQRPSAPEGMQTCARCGTLNRAGIPFCQNCGANLRATAPAAQAGVAAPGVAQAAVATARPTTSHGRAVLGPLVLIIGAVGLAVAWLLPFMYGDENSLFERSFGTPDGYQLQFWNDYPEVGPEIVDQAYFGFAAPVPILVLIVVILAIAGFMRARPGLLQVLGLVIAFLWVLGLGVLFVVVEVLGAPTSELTGLLRALTPAGIIFLLASLITLIGLLTRFARS